MEIDNVLKLHEQSFEVVQEIIKIQDQKIKILTDFLEYEEALTVDKATASRIKRILTEFDVWEDKQI